MFLEILKKVHSGIGILILFALLLIILYLVVRYVIKKPFNKANNTAALIGVVLVHSQILLGLILYVISPVGLANFSGEAMSDKVSRIYILEHPIGMIVATVLITIGYMATKNDRLSDVRKYSRVLLLYAIGYSFIPHLGLCGGKIYFKTKYINSRCSASVFFISVLLIVTSLFSVKPN